MTFTTVVYTPDLADVLDCLLNDRVPPLLCITIATVIVTITIWVWLGGLDDVMIFLLDHAAGGSRP